VVTTSSTRLSTAPTREPASVARAAAASAAVFASAAERPAASAFESTAPMRSAFCRVCSWVFSTVPPRVSTLVLTPPTSVRTNFFVAHAGATATVSASIDAAKTLLRMMFFLLSPVDVV
jgi:hypothetical protein